MPVKSDFCADLKYDIFPRATGDNCDRKRSNTSKRRKNERDENTGPNILLRGSLFWFCKNI